MSTMFLKKFLFLVLLCVLSLWAVIQSFARTIDYTLTPIKYELNLQPWESITLPASIRNNSTWSVLLTTSKSDFQASWPWWVPSIVRKSELVFPDQELSSWITVAESSLTLAPWQEGTTNFTIDVPTNATPWGHYGAVIFNTPRDSGGSWDIAIDVDYGIIILVNVSWDVIVDVDVWEPTIWWNGGNGSWPTWTTIDWFNNVDNCPLGDFTPSRYDRKCVWSVPENPDNSLLLPSIFNIDFSIPIDNNGNTHIKPEWKIVLKDENGNTIKAIWKKVIINERWAIIWEEITDYIPINDQQGNVLPKTKRVFESVWEGFPYKTYDDEGNQIIKYWTPGEYYTRKNQEEVWFLMPWQRVSEILKQRKITAEIEIVYKDENGNPIDFTTAKEFDIQYLEKQITLNPYVILWLLLLATAWVFILFGTRWWFLVAKTKKCWNCWEKIKSHWKACPHCKALQNKKKHKKLEKEREKSKKK